MDLWHEKKLEEIRKGIIEFNYSWPFAGKPNGYDNPELMDINNVLQDANIRAFQRFHNLNQKAGRQRLPAASQAS